MRPLFKIFRGVGLITYLSILLLGVIIALWLAVNRRNLSECIESYRVRNTVRIRVQKLSKKVKELEEEKRMLETGLEENEIAVRERFRMVREGEHLVLVEREETRNEDE